MEIDVLIDELTDCLVERSTGKQEETEYRVRTALIKPEEYKGWKFDWSVTEKNGYNIYELFLKNDNIVQGRIATRVDGGVVDVDIVETAPHNYGCTGKYQGVGGHLFAIACQISKESGCDGFVTFTAKSDLISYYEKVLNARVARGQRMYIDEAAADILIRQYIEK